MEQYVNNASSGYGDIIPLTALGKLMNLSAYRYSPIFLKPFFWQDTNFYNQDILKEDATVAYSFDDVKHGKAFSNGSADRNEKAFKLYHLNGPHAPYTIDKFNQRRRTVDGLYGISLHRVRQNEGIGHL